MNNLISLATRQIHQQLAAANFELLRLRKLWNEREKTEATRDRDRVREREERESPEQDVRSAHKVMKPEKIA